MHADVHVAEPFAARTVVSIIAHTQFHTHTYSSTKSRNHTARHVSFLNRYHTIATAAYQSEDDRATTGLVHPAHANLNMTDDPPFSLQ
jgi:hypothetical protein